MYPHKPCISVIIVLLLILSPVSPARLVTACGQAVKMLYGKANPLFLSSPSLQYRISQVARKEKREIQGFAVDEIPGLPGGLELRTTKLHSGAERIDFFFQSESEGAGSSVDAATRCVLKLKLPYLVGIFRLSNDLL